MAATIAPVHASGSPGNGRAIKVTTTSSPGTLLHTASNTSGVFDEVTVYVYNSDTVPREITVEAGGTAAPDDQVKASIAPRAGLQLVLPGRRFNGGAVIRAFGSVANVLTCHPDINRYTP